MSRWTEADIPSQAGRTALVTGANSGVGYWTSYWLAGKGARVLLACRDAARGEAAAQAIRRDYGLAKLGLVPLDLGDLDSVRALGRRVTEPLDLLINNAGVMAVPVRRLTRQGFELQFGTNHLGPFALTALLLPRLEARPGTRIVTVASTAHRRGVVRFDDLQSERRYRPWAAYAQSKLANLLFAFELDRRLRAAGSPVISVAVHPGVALTNLQYSGPRLGGASLMSRLMPSLVRVTGQSAEAAARPSLYAATMPDVGGGDYLGPTGWREMRGSVGRASASRRARDEAAARRLWEASERLTGVRFAWRRPPHDVDR